MRPFLALLVLILLSGFAAVPAHGQPGGGFPPPGPYPSVDEARRTYENDNTIASLAALVDALVETTDRSYLMEARALSFRLIRMNPAEVDPWAAATAAALASGDLKLLEEALSGLERLAPDHHFTHEAKGIRAAAHEDWSTAEREILLARDRGLPQSAADVFLDHYGIRAHMHRERMVRRVLGGVGLWFGGMLLLLALGMLLSRLTLFAVARQSPEATGNATGGVKLVRRVYAATLGATSAYFYLSLPVILLIVLAGGGGLIYWFFTGGHVPIKLVLVVGLFMAVTAYSLITALFRRVRESDPGLSIPESEAPRLFTVLREVAERIGTRMVDRVFLTPDTAVAVFERGSSLSSKRRERCLILGLGVLKGMSLGQLKAILAHEFGHFSNRDTAGGGLALHVRRTIHFSAQSMARGGAASWFNPGWLFLNFFYRVFLRVSQGASRLQEVLADRWAAMSYGGRTFSDGLEHVIRRSIEFDFLSDREVQEAVDQKRTIRNLYDLDVPAQWSEAERRQVLDATPAALIERISKQVMKQPASAFDSHPPPAQRIAWVGRIEEASPPQAEPESAWSIFPDPAALQERMTGVVRENVRTLLAAGGRDS